MAKNSPCTTVVSYMGKFDYLRPSVILSSDAFSCSHLFQLSAFAQPAGQRSRIVYTSCCNVWLTAVQYVLVSNGTCCD